jgi:alpha-L-fucosidase
VAAALDGDPDTFWSALPGSNHSTLEVSFAHPVRFNRALTMEWLNEGQRIEQYSIDVWMGSGWKTVAAAHAIGHEKIDVFPAVTASRVRLNILSSTNGAAIREFQLYNVASSADQH